MEWMILTLAIGLNMISSVIITLSAVPSAFKGYEISNRFKAIMSTVGLIGAGLGYYLLSVALQELSLIAVFGMWGGASALSSAVVLLLFYPQTWTWRHNIFLLMIGIGMFGLLYTS